MFLTSVSWLQYAFRGRTLMGSQKLKQVLSVSVCLVRVVLDRCFIIFSLSFNIFSEGVGICRGGCVFECTKNVQSCYG